MATTRTALTNADIRTLIKGPAEHQRAIVAQRLCRRIESEALTPEARVRAQEILTVMAADAAEQVRRALAITLGSSSLVPRDVALKLARDVDSVAFPILAFSPAFTDDDLVEVVRLGDPIRQLAVARRPKLATPVADAIAEHGSEKAVETACANDNAQFSEGGLSTAIERFSASETVLQAVAFRRTLPLSITERLINVAGEGVRRHLTANHDLDGAVALKLVMGAKERATIDVIDELGRTVDVRVFANHLRASGRLTASLMLRAMAHGHMSFVEHGLSELAGVPHHRTWLMVHDAGPLGLKAIYERAGLPARLFTAFRAGVDTYHALEQEGGLRDACRFQEKMLERFLTQPQPALREDLDYLMDKLDRVRGEAGMAVA